MGGEYKDLKGTTIDSFKIGKQKFNIDASAATALRQMTLPDALINFTGGSNGDVLTKTASGFTIQPGFGRVESGAASLSGTIQGSLFVNGDLTLAGDLTINGDLYVLGNIINDHVSGHGINVKGSIYCRDKIDFKGNSNGSGTGYNGGFVIAEGNVSAYAGIDSSGGQGSTNGGNGGNLDIVGDIKTGISIYMFGGEGLSGTGGKGGTINFFGSSGQATGNIYAGHEIHTYGGQGTTAGGTGGTIDSGGSIVTGNSSITWSIKTSGGRSLVSGPGGPGGYIQAKKDIEVPARIETAGGSVFSSSSGSIGGSIVSLNGSIRASQIFASGSTGSSGAGYVGGNGGDIIAGISIFCTGGNITSGGGSANSSATGNANGGNGGNVTAHDSIILFGGISISGGHGYDTGVGGSPGNIFTYKDIWCGAFIGISAVNSGNNSNIAASNGGAVQCNNLRCAQIFMHGGSIASGGIGTGNGGDGGALTILAGLNCSSIGGNGGNPGSGGGNTGNGGTITCDNDMNCPDIAMYGRDGTTNCGNGGSITVHGKFIIGAYDVRGGSVLSGGGASSAGNGGSLTVHGDLINLAGHTLSFQGGSSNFGGHGGAAGNITIHGAMNTPQTSFNVYGGDSTDATEGQSGGNVTAYGKVGINNINISGGAGGTVAGSPGVLSLNNGGRIAFINAQDGSSGTTGIQVNRGIMFSGTLTVIFIWFSNRAGIEISVSATGDLAIFKCEILNGPNTLTRGVFGSAQTAGLVNKQQKIYSYANSAWYAHAGTAI